MNKKLVIINNNLRHLSTRFIANRSIVFEWERTKISDSTPIDTKTSFDCGNTCDTIRISMKGLNKTQFPLKRRNVVILDKDYRIYFKS